MITGSPPNSCGDDKKGRGSVILPFFGVLVLSEALLVVVVVIEEIMQFAHEQLDVCQISPEYAVRESWVPYGDYDNENECPCLGDLCVLCERKSTSAQHETLNPEPLNPTKFHMRQRTVEQR